MNLVISKCVTAVKVSIFTGHYLPNRSTLDIGVLGFFGKVYKEHPPEVWSVPPVTPFIYSRHQGDDLFLLENYVTGGYVTKN